MARDRSLVVPGRPAPEVRRADDPVDFEVVHEAHVDARSRSAGFEHVVGDLSDDDIVEIGYEGGFQRWTSVGRMRVEQERRAGARVRGPLRLAREGDARRGFDWILKALRILRIDPANEMAQWSARRITEHFVSRLAPGPGLYRITSPLEMDGAKAAEDIDAEPHLLLLHGTFSSSRGSFGGLANPRLGPGAPWASLQQAYGDRILALEHDTLGRSPIENALEVARSLPEGARLHLLSHSRGGLVGELLCAGGISEADFARYRRRGREAWDEQDREALRELAAALSSRNVRVERFVRVACPVQGTTLGDRLDLFLSVTLNLLGRVPALEGNPLFALGKETLLRLLRLREEPELPGIEAQMPDSPLVRMLALAAPTDADLAVVAGDLDGRGFTRAVFEWVTNVFYRDKRHDLVVPTSSMSGGIPRSGETFYACAEGSDVDHFSYFANSPSAGWVVSGLREGDRRQGFGPSPEARRARRGLVRASAAIDGTRPVVVLLPGIMGTRLSAGGREVWLDLGELAGGGLGELGLDAAVGAGGLLERAYGDLVDHLSGSHQVRPFPYDWRLSLRHAADELAGELERILATTNQPVRLLAHSMGGLVARALQARHADVWRRVVQRSGSRLIMLGTPNAGSFAIPRMLLGRDRLIRMLALLDFDHSLSEILSLVATYPGVLELLPRHASSDFDAFDEAAWAPLREANDDRWTVPSGDALTAARRFRDELDGCEIDTEHTLYVAGQDRSTPMAVEVRGRRVLFHATGEGDGRVPWETGRLEGVRTWYMPVDHGSLSSAERYFPALDDLLESGDTERLSTEAPAKRGRSGIHETPDVDDVVFPSEAELEDAALGSNGEGERQDSDELRVSVVHGDAGRVAGRIVMLGHHENDTIVSAEAALDAAMGGRLGNRYQLGSYPGPIGTQSCFAQTVPRQVPAGVLVVGLGQVGELGPAQLRDTVTRGVLELALLPDGGIGPSLTGDGRMASLLMGAGEGSRLSIRDSLRAVTEGVMDANRRLRDLGRPPVVSDLCFVELFEDRAIAAARELAALEPTLNRDDPVEVARVLVTGVDGRQRTYAGQGAEAWWRRVLISQPSRLADASSQAEGRMSRLEFKVLTDRAGAEAVGVDVQETVMSHLSALAVEGGAGRSSVGSMLLRHAVPRSLRGRLLEGERTLLLVDRSTAAIPWELLTEGSDEFAIPYAVRSGMMRQFVGQPARHDVRYAGGLRALVIGDPSLEGTPGFRPLAGAQEEARAVAKVLAQAEFDVGEPLIGARWPSILRMIQRPVRILHIAGHGEFDAQQPLRSGVILSDGVRITAAEVVAMDPLPEFVFLNCCYLARMAGSGSEVPTDRAQLAATISEALMGAGVRAVVAAGWPVGDGPAVDFATVLYEQLLSGQPLGVATRIARESIHPGDGSTWGAYQCYGDPDFTLTAQRDSPPRLKAPIVSRRELLDRISNLSATGEGGRESLVRALQNEIDLAEPSWIDGEVRAAAGEALRRSGCFDEAIEQFEKAVRNPRPGAPLRAAEQLANLRVRSVAGTVKELEAGRRISQKHRQGAQRTVRGAVRELKALLRVAPTGERHSLLGSAYKRMAALALADERSGWLEQAAVEYGKAFALARDEGGDIAYPALNELRCELLALGDAPQGLDADQRLALEAARAEAALRSSREDCKLWDLLTFPDALLVETLAEGTLVEPETRERILESYLGARSRGDVGDFRSVIEEFDFMLLMIPPRKPSWKPIREALETLRAETE